MFEAPEMLMLLGLLPVMGLLFIVRSRARGRAVARLGDAALVAKLNTQVDSAARRWKSALWLMALAALIVAMARPVWGTEFEIIEARGVAVIIALDVSISMDAQDIAPSRLERAKQTIRDIMTDGAGNLFALVVFAGDAYVQFPLTGDIESALTFVDAVSTGLVARQGTNIADAISLAQGVYDSRLAQEGILVLMSDGEHHEVTADSGESELSPVDAARAAREAGLTVHVIGYGTPDGDQIPVVNPDGSVTFKTDAGSRMVITRLNEPVLEEAAAAGGGTYRRANASGIDAVELSAIIAQVDADVTDAQRASRGVERFGIFVLAALALLSLEMLLPERRAARKGSV